MSTANFIGLVGWKWHRIQYQSQWALVNISEKALQMWDRWMHVRGRASQLQLAHCRSCPEILCSRRYLSGISIFGTWLLICQISSSLFNLTKWANSTVHLMSTYGWPPKISLHGVTVLIAVLKMGCHLWTCGSVSQPDIQSSTDW